MKISESGIIVKGRFLRKVGNRIPKYAKFLIMFLLFLSVPLIEARAEEILTWEDCVKEAKKNHPDLLSAKEKLNQTKANKAITRSNLLPQISSSVSGRTSKTAGENGTDSYSYGITGKQTLFDGFKTFSDLAAASKNIESAQYNYQVTSSDIRLSLRTAFVELLRAQELLQITEDIATRRKQNVELVRLRYEVGREHKGSLLTAQANLAQAEFEVAQARRNIDLAERRLTKELGRTEMVPVRAKGDFEIKYSYQEKPDFERLSQNTPFMQGLIAKKEAARLGSKSAKANLFPQISANASTGGSASHWPPDRNEWSVGVGLSLPLFEGGSRTAEISRANAAFKQAEADERSGRDSVILTLEDTWIGLQDAIDRIKVQQKFVEATEERAKIAQAQYSTGLISFDDWTIIEDGLVTAKKSFLDVQANALIAEANWIQATGGMLDEE